MTYGSLTEVEYFYPGQVVKLKHPIGQYAIEGNNFFTITKVNPKNLKVTQNSTGKGLQGDARIFTAVPKDETARVPAAPEKPAIDWSKFKAGAIVRFTGAKRPSAFKYPLDQLFVVTKHNFDRVNIVPIGGSLNGSYWRMSPTNLTVVDPETITTV